MKDKILNAFLKIKSQLGENALFNGQLLIGAFSDIAPQLKAEKQVLMRIVEINGHTSLANNMNNSAQQKVECQKIVKTLKEKYGIDSALAAEVCIAYVEAICGNKLLITDFFISINNPPSPKPVPHEKNFAKYLIAAACVFLAIAVIISSNGNKSSTNSYSTVGSSNNTYSSSQNNQSASSNSTVSSSNNTYSSSQNNQSTTSNSSITNNSGRQAAPISRTVSFGANERFWDGNYFKSSRINYNVFTKETAQCYGMSLNFSAKVRKTGKTLTGTYSVYVRSKQAEIADNDSGWILVGTFELKEKDDVVMVNLDWSSSYGATNVYAAAIIPAGSSLPYYDASWGSKVTLYYYE